jgi:hypothetical protein
LNSFGVPTRTVQHFKRVHLITERRAAPRTRAPTKNREERGGSVSPFCNSGSLLLGDKHNTGNEENKMPEDIQSREARHGEKMIEVKVRFWTDNIAPEQGKVIPKHAWTSGVVRMNSNRAHGIVPKKPAVFNSLLDVGSVIEKVLIEHGVVLRPSTRMKKYVKDPG